MQALQELLANRVLISGLVGWGAAQVLKTIIYALMHHTLDLTRIFGDGGMPSGHSPGSSSRCPTRKSSRSSWGIRRCRSAWALCSASPPAFCAISARETRKNLSA